MRKASNNWNLAKDFLEKENLRLSLRWSATALPGLVMEGSDLGAGVVQLLHDPIVKDLLAATVGIDTPQKRKSGWVECVNHCFVRSAEWENGRGSARKNFKSELEASGVLAHMLRRASAGYPTLGTITTEDIVSVQQYGAAEFTPAAVWRRQLVDGHLRALTHDEGEGEEEEGFESALGHARLKVRVGDSVRMDIIAPGVLDMDQWGMAHWTDPDIAVVKKIWTLGNENQQYLVLELGWLVSAGYYAPCRRYKYPLYRRQNARERMEWETESWFTPGEVIDKAVMLPHVFLLNETVSAWIYLREAFPV